MVSTNLERCTVAINQIWRNKYLKLNSNIKSKTGLSIYSFKFDLSYNCSHMDYRFFITFAC